MGGNGGRGRIKKLPGWLEQRLDWEPLVWKTGAYAPDALANYETTETIWKIAPKQGRTLKLLQEIEPQRAKLELFAMTALSQKKKRFKILIQNNLGTKEKKTNLNQNDEIWGKEQKLRLLKKWGVPPAPSFQKSIRFKSSIFSLFKFFLFLIKNFQIFFFKNLWKRHFVSASKSGTKRSFLLFVLVALLCVSK